MVRKQKNQICKGSDPCIDNLVGFTQEGFESFTATYVLGCEKWKPGFELTALRDVVKQLQMQGALRSGQAK